MKKPITMLVTAAFAAALAAAFALTFAACASAPKTRRVPGNFPDFVRSAVKSQPKDSVIGIGVAKTGSLSQSRTISATRARAEISRQIETIVKDMITDYTESSELDASASTSYQEVITVALSKSVLTGAEVVDEGEDKQGRYWTVVCMSKAQTAEKINQAASSAKLAAPKMAAFDAAARMDKAFDKLASEDVQAAGD